MKIFKIFFALIFSLILAFSLVSCGEEPKDGEDTVTGDKESSTTDTENEENGEKEEDGEPSKEDDKDPSTENAGGENGGGSSSDTSERDKYILMLSSALGGAETLKFNVSFDAGISMTDDEECGFFGSQLLSVVISKTDMGYNARLDLVGEGDELFKSLSLYLVDDVVYVYNSDGLILYEIHALEENGGLSAIGNALSELFSDALPNVSAKRLGELVKKAFAELFDSGVSLVDGDFVFEKDFADEVNSIIASINSEGADKTDLEEVIDSFLEKQYPGVSVDSIFDSVKPLGGMTVNEFYGKINTFLLDNAASDVKTVYESLMSSEMIFDVLMESGLSEEDVLEIKDLDFDALLSEYGEMSLDELVGAALGDDRATFKFLVSYLKAAIFSVSVSELFEEAGLSEYLDIIKTLDVRTLSQKLIFKIGEGLSFAGIAYNADLSIVSDSLSADIKIAVEISEISDLREEIALPREHNAKD